jgi:mRNA interferase MazF
MNRGDLYWAKLPLPVGRRPVVLVSRASAYAVRTSVTVAEVTTTIRGIPCEVKLGTADGLPRSCAINADNLHTIPTELLGERIAALRPERVRALDEALRFSLGLR